MDRDWDYCSDQLKGLLRDLRTDSQKDKSTVV